MAYGNISQYEHLLKILRDDFINNVGIELLTGKVISKQTRI